MTAVQGKEAEDLLNEVMTNVLEKMVKNPERAEVYLKAFNMIMDSDFTGISDEVKNVLSEYLLLKQKIIKVDKLEE